MNFDFTEISKSGPRNTWLSPDEESKRSTKCDGQSGTQAKILTEGQTETLEK